MGICSNNNSRFFLFFSFIFSIFVQKLYQDFNNALNLTSQSKLFQNFHLVLICIIIYSKKENQIQLIQTHQYFFIILFIILIKIIKKIYILKSKCQNMIVQNYEKQITQELSMKPLSTLQNKNDLNQPQRNLTKLTKQNMNDEKENFVKVRQIKPKEFQQDQKITNNMESLERKQQTTNKLSILQKIQNKTNQCENLILQKNFQQSGSNLIKKNIQFEQINFDEQQSQYKNNFDVQQLYQSIDLSKNGNQKTKRPKETKKQGLMSYICSLLSSKLKIKRKRSQIQNKLLQMNELKITGTRQQQLLLLEIGKHILYQQPTLISQDWKRIGFPSKDPVKQLEDEGILTILQWRCFLISHKEQAQKMANFCIQMNSSLFNFHRITTQVFCQHIIKHKIIAQTWNEFQQSYNLLLQFTFAKVVQKSKTSTNNIQQFIMNTLKKANNSEISKYNISKMIK